MAEAAVALGSNLGDKAAQLRAAIALLDAEPDIRVTARSRLYRTPPWGDTDQDWFVNAVVLVDTGLSSHDLLACCLDIERQLGRARDTERRWGPRAIDLDLIFHEAGQVRSESLTLPHPRLFERAFVLKPLAEIAPDLVIDGRRVADALAAVSEDAVAISLYED